MSQLSRRFVVTLLGSAALLPTLGAPAFALPATPEDQAPRDAALVRVRAVILKATQARDFNQLQPHVSPRIQLDYGGGAGLPLMRKRFAAKGSPLWEELRWVMEHGGRFEKDGSFAAPYLHSMETGGLDPFEAGGIVVDKVVARAQPRADAPEVATLGRVVVKVTDWKHSDKTPSPFYKRTDWVKLELSGKREAWIEAKHVRSVVDYRAGFEKKGGAWKMTFFLAGD